MMRILPNVGEEYRGILLDFRGEMFQRLTFITAIFSALTSYAILFIKPLPYHLFLLAWSFVVYIIWVRQLAHQRPNLARYLFVITMYMSLFSGMIMYNNVWLALPIFPILLVSALLMSNTNVIGAIIFFIAVSVMELLGHASYPLSLLAFTLGLSVAVNHTAVSTFNVALKWYFSMHERADKLLTETRDRRAELIQTLKSLEIAYDTQKRLQQQLVYAREQAEEARRMKERFASNISHELRTPLNLILGFSEIIHLTPEVYGNVQFTPTLHRDIHQIYRSSRHLLDMIDDVLDLSHVELSQFTLNYEQTEMTPFLSDVATMLQNLFAAKSLDFLIDIDPNLPSLEIDRTRIRQVIINLANNAQRFTQYGFVKLYAYQSHNNVWISIQDTGNGIAEDKRHLIFEEFYQVDYSLSRKHGGAGLGLPITKRFVEAHLGSIHLESEVNVGSTFTIRLPLPNQRIHNNLATDNAPSKPRQSILVYDADEHVQSLIARHLSDFDILPVSPSSSKHLKNIIKQHHPLGMIINQHHLNTVDLEAINIPIIKCSLPSTSWLINQLQVDDCLSKPVRPQQVHDTLKYYPDAHTILIVDDDLGFVQLVQRSIELTECDYTIMRAYDGKHALDVIQSRQPDLIFLDLAMPELNGFGVLDAIRNNPQWRDIPIILMTSTQYIQEAIEGYGSLSLIHPHGLRPLTSLKGIQSLLNILL